MSNGLKDANSSDEKLTNCYRMNTNDAADPNKRDARIALFCHAGTSMTLLSHLLSIPLPLVFSAFWLAPSSVTTILFEEHDDSKYQVDGVHDSSDCIFLTPRALNVGSTAHLSAAGLQTENSLYEEWKRPAGIKNNFW